MADCKTKLYIFKTPLNNGVLFFCTMDFISGTLIKVDELANTLQVCLDSGAKKVLIPSTSFVDFVTVTAELASAFQIIPYQSAEDAVFKALGVD